MAIYTCQHFWLVDTALTAIHTVIINILRRANNKRGHKIIGIVNLV